MVEGRTSTAHGLWQPIRTMTSAKCYGSQRMKNYTFSSVSIIHFRHTMLVSDPTSDLNCIVVACVSSVIDWLFLSIEMCATDRTSVKPCSEGLTECTGYTVYHRYIIKHQPIIYLLYFSPMHCLHCDRQRTSKQHRTLQRDFKYCVRSRLDKKYNNIIALGTQFGCNEILSNGERGRILQYLTIS